MRGRDHGQTHRKTGWNIATAVLMCAMVLGICGAIPAAAATDRAISGATIRVGLTIEPGDMLPDHIAIYTDSSDVQEDKAYVGTNSPRYWVRDAEWVTSAERYLSVGEVPKLRVYLEPEVGNAFRGSYGSSSITVKGGTFVSARREGDGELAVVISVPVRGTYAAPANAQWRDSGLGRAEWNTDVDRYDDYIIATTSGYYDVYLYRGSTVVHKLEDYHGESYNFYPYMTRKGTYTFRVRTVPHTESQKQYGKKSEWTESDEFYIDEENVSDGTGRTNTNGTVSGITEVGWIQSEGTWYFRYPNGTYQTNGWLKLNEIWYLFDSSGRMLTGWQQDKGQWYYLQANGAMLTGWIKEGDYWYYLNTLADGGTEGAMHTGWLTTGGKTYYLNSSGIMLEGWQEIDKKCYYFYPGYGYMAKDTTIGPFYVDANGVWIP